MANSKRLISLIFWAFSIELNAQLVVLPDTNFVNWLDTSGFSSCLNGNQLDTTCSKVLSTKSITLGYLNIYDLTGIQYFKNLDSLSCNALQLTFLPELNNTLSYLECYAMNISTLPKLPDSLKILNLEQLSYLTQLPSLPEGLTSLGCSSNYLTSLPILPNGLRILGCIGQGGSGLHQLPRLPDSLRILTCDQNPISFLPLLPSFLDTLTCDDDSLNSLPDFPASLKFLSCQKNQITLLPSLSATSVQVLKCVQNQFRILPRLPQSIHTVLAGQNYQLDSIEPPFPDSLTYLDAQMCAIKRVPSLPPGQVDLSYNNIDSIPPIPPGLDIHILNLNYNNLIIMPSLPRALKALGISANQITYIPPLPDSITSLSAADNPNLQCLPELKNTLTFLGFVNTAVACVPNFVSIANCQPLLSSLPLCDSINPNNCPLTSATLRVEGVSFKIYPNPATDYAIVDYGFTDWSKAQPNLEICNALGQVVYVQILPMYNGLQKIDVSGFAAGMYTVYVKREGGVANAKLVKE